ncbi:titin isoform X2 [Diabrotica virgifera virgifera]|uniref:Chromo domain-containing protein n=1 Tax=Diabrotica virgifera virgifera TaxID=50390 RepID=A0ABM5K6X7_DIAVI|nr:titin isoform X2 [Diabrotica virgifera virgifera]
MDEKSEHGDQTAEIHDPVVGSLDEGMDIRMDPEADVSAVDSAENAGTSQDTETPEVAEPNIESAVGNDDNTLISELNDVSLSAAATSNETDSFLDSFTSENPTSESQANDDQNSNAADSDLSMPALVLPDEPNDMSTEDMSFNEKPEGQEEPVVEPPKDLAEAPVEAMKDVQKEPVYSLEEELERMHEESVQPETEPVQKHAESEKPEEVNVPESKVHTESKPTPIMKDSDLEEMLAADDVLQDPLMIKNAQQDLGKVDVLVCGNCHQVFHFVEEFKTHKSKICSTKSNSTLSNDSNSQVWAFTLWKTKQVKEEPGRGQTQWELYKTWCALPESDKTSWISAGELLQYCHKLETAKVTEVKVHNKPVAKDDKDPLSLDGFGKNSNKENSSVDNSKSPLLDVKRTVINKPKPVPTVPKINNNSANTNKAMRSAPNLDKSEYAVEKIAAKRFNPKKKTWEYQIKWEHFTSEHNTWEPLSNLNHCRQMVDEFEEQLKKLKAEKAKQQQIAAAASKNTPKVKQIVSAVSSPSLAGTGPKNRPQRTSKQKALEQVKSWCGNISDEEGISMKRPRSPDSDDSFSEKRMKFEEMSEDSDGEVSKPKMPLRKIAPKPPASPLQVIKNGVGKNTPLPQNILIPDANGVVRINQKQLPSLSTGVYIMSKTAGIIKLDSSTSKVATSSGQMIVKVAPKIGQTHIKIMKKDGTSTQQVVQMSPKNIQQTPKALKSHLTKAKKSLSELKASPAAPKKAEVLKKQVLTPTKMDIDKKQMVVKKLPELAPKPGPKAFLKFNQVESREEESDDGLEELPFPEEIKLPEPEEEEADKDFILDPTTGKIAGVEYPEHEPEPIEEAKSDMSLDNIVKLAAADITEEDLKNEPQEEPMDIEVHHLVQAPEPVKIIKTEPQIVPERRFPTAASTKQVVKMPVTSRKVIANPTSILNKALTGPQVIRRAVTGSAEKQQRVLNHSMARPIVNPVVRQTKTFVRTKPVAPKPRFNIASDMSEKFIQPDHNTSPKNVYSFTRQVVPSPTMRKIGNTTIRSSPAGVSAANNQHKVQTTKYVRTSSGLVQKVVQTQVRREPMQVRGQPERVERKIQQKPKTVINMPSLISDDDLLLTTKPAQPRPKQAPVQPVQTIAALEAHEPEEAHKMAVVSEPSITQVPAAIQQEPEENAAAETSGINALAPDMSSFTLNDHDNPIFITGDDGTVYQVAGQNEQGQTILLTQGSDGQQQCLLVTNEIAETMETPAAEEAEPQQQEIIPEISPAVTDPLSIKTDVTESSDQVVAQVVRAEPPSPGGTHKVVVMLPDGNLMITQVSPEEYASLELE